MADGATVKIDTSRLIGKFRALVPAAYEEVEAAALASAEEVAGLARRLVHDGGVRETIHVEPLPERLAALVVAGDESTLVEVRKGSGIMINRARLEEYGTKPHTIGGKFKGAHHPGTKPNPFLFAAAQLAQRAVKSRFSRAISKAAHRVAG